MSSLEGKLCAANMCLAEHMLWKVWVQSGLMMALERITHFWDAKALDQFDKSNCLK